MLILGVSGKKQSGKSTTGNFIYSLYMLSASISEEVYINGYGQIVVSDLLGDRNYAGVFDPTNKDEKDYVKSKVFGKLDPIVRIYNFADPLKQLCVDILGLERHQCYGTDEEKNEKVDCFWNDKQCTGREVMQIVGTDWFRTMQPNVWAGASIRRIQKDKPNLAIITDCRFPNEVQAIKNAGGKVLRLSRNPHNSDHISETILDENNYNWNNFDYVIDNSSMDLIEQLIKTKEELKDIL